MGLETPAEYAGPFKALPEETQESWLQTSLAQVDTFPETVERRIDIWRRGDWRADEKLFLESYGGSAVAPFCTDECKQRMTDKIKEYLNTAHTYFVTIGAGHFVGKDGIVDRLRHHGHTVKWLGPFRIHGQTSLAMAPLSGPVLDARQVRALLF